ncbi:hypothetical protein TVAG_353190 [Trichomonas vaginalis G3]|uniref:Uncharacterized protein n=1 Tax=Trichomonas vaginalis (strain ATCC PRA-98 / G3) TaxID=412133 RepID=A2GG93_TRIV3|nr:hypothetical protein TVAGG3_0377940 [Trichomonas vaginalis G3]EAX83823.1 hypothetical protein TVAG_353190 [Trichomonas vaginalis G3]KAI5533076.1 hypothetical protein TVAGG3_0377940 [Trichomonas vaginalis G3]|eukprot:XP_001296753.1 hypothetical protein [Trichomonas vaginalis G3]
MSESSNEESLEDIASLLDISFANEMLRREIDLQSLANAEENSVNLNTISNPFVMDLLDKLDRHEKNLQKELDVIVLERAKPDGIKKVFTTTPQNRKIILRSILVANQVQDLEQQKEQLVKENQELLDFIQICQ